MNFLDQLKELGGYWKYEGGRYLAKLTSGQISDEFVNTGVLTCRPGAMRRPCANLIYKLAHTADLPVQVLADYPWEDPYLREWSVRSNLRVCGPAMGGVTLAYEIANQLGAISIFTEPVYDTGLTLHMPSGPDMVRVKKVGQTLKRFKIPEDAKVLFVEDVITTGKSTQEMISCIDGLDAVVPYVLCLVNRSGLSEIEVQCQTSHGLNKCKFEIISLAKIIPRTWDTIEDAQAALRRTCKNHNTNLDTTGTNGLVEVLPQLEAVRPKENWNLLTKGSPDAGTAWVRRS